MAADPWAECERLLSAAGKEADALQDLCTGADLLDKAQKDQRVSLLGWLGEEADVRAFGSLLCAGDVGEVFGPPGVGKTQVGLSVAAHCAAAGHSVTYIATKDLPEHLALRMHDILVAQGHSVESIYTALGNVNVIAVHDFPDFARVVTADALHKEKDGQRRFPTLMIIDSLSCLLVPFAATSGGAFRGGAIYGSAHRWRLAWASRTLRQMAVDLGVRILLISHTTGGTEGGLGAQLALGQLWAAAASTRLELSSDDHCNFSNESTGLRLTLRKSQCCPVGLSTSLILDGAGVRARPCGK